MEESAPYNEIEYKATVKVLFDFYDLKAEAIEEIYFTAIESTLFSEYGLEQYAKAIFKDKHYEMFSCESNIDIIVLDVKRN